MFFPLTLVFGEPMAKAVLPLWISAEDEVNLAFRWGYSGLEFRQVCP
jgi:hypothetical protein